MEGEQENLGRRIVIAPASSEDTKDIQDVFYKTWLDTYPNAEAGITVDDIEDRYKDAFTEDTLRKRAERISNPPEGEILLVAKENDRTIGLCRVVISDTENRIQAIYVLPEYQGKGIGRKLWEEARKLFDPEKNIHVAVATYNTNAIEFYRRLGFEDTGKRWTDEKLKMKSGSVIPEMEMIINAKEE